MPKEKFNKKLLVEGNDDKHVVWALCEKFQIAESFDVIDCEGISNLLVQIPVRLKQSGITTLGLIIDADTDISNRWISLQNILERSDFNLPHEMSPDGLIVESNGVKIGIWIMPDNVLNGMLEDFISFLVPKDDSLIELASITVQKIEERKLNKYSALHKMKALIHTWLAWQEVPGTPMGLAITKRYLTTDQETCSRFVKWLTNVFA